MLPLVKNIAIRESTEADPCEPSGTAVATSTRLDLKRDVTSMLATVLIGLTFLSSTGLAFLQDEPETGLSDSKTRAIEAAVRGDAETVSSCLATGVSSDLAQPDGTTLVHWAVFHRDLGMLRALNRRKARLDQRNRYGVTPLSLACEYGHVACAKFLIENQVDIESARPGKESPLMYAGRCGAIEIVKALIEAGAKVDAVERNGQTALMWAAAAGEVDVVRTLLDAGASRDQRTHKSGFNAFLFAAREGRKNVCAEMCKRARLSGEKDFPNQTLEVKRAGGRNPRKNMSALMLAIESGHLQLALELVKAGADPNDQRSGFGPLHAITWVRRTKLGDNPAGDPAPRITGDVSSLEFVQRIVSLGADVNLQLSEGKANGKAALNSKGASPFLLAAQTADLPLMKLLVNLGADPTLVNADQCNALMACAGIGAVAVGEEPCSEAEVIAALEWLNQFDIDVNHVDQNGETAMHGAAYRNYPEVVLLLGKMGAKPTNWNRKNRFGWSPFDIGHGRRPGSLKPSPPTLKALHTLVEK